jgi:(2Fe-2S) ferredoxin
LGDAFRDRQAEARVAGTHAFGATLKRLDERGDQLRGELLTGVIYLVCTHGKHDPCCAQHGRSVALSLTALRPGRVWQASHLGGCRFAPTVLVLPLGLMYGRVSPTAGTEFIAAAEAGEVLGAKLRGRIGMPPAAQAAVGFAHEHLALSRCRDVSLVSTTPFDSRIVVVRVSSPNGLFDVTVKRERVDAIELTCAAPGPSWFIAHHPVAIEPVDGV